MESCPAQAVLPLVGLAAEKVIRDRYIGLFWLRGTLSLKKVLKFTAEHHGNVAF
ncbi:MAG: hypothetical protein R6U98_23615 [Pirellulaceae bacterium]